MAFVQRLLCEVCCLVSQEPRLPSVDSSAQIHIWTPLSLGSNKEIASLFHICACGSCTKARIL